MQFVLNTAPAGQVKDIYQSGSTILDRPLSKGNQDFQTDPSLYPLNQPVQKLEAQIQSSGEAQYSNDVPPSKHDVFGSFVISSVSSGDVDSIDVEDVLVSKISIGYLLSIRWDVCLTVCQEGKKILRVSGSVLVTLC